VPYNDSIVSSDDRLRDALERALADARTQLELELRTLTHELSDAAATTLASAAGALDRGASLAEVLRALVDTSATYADRVGLFLIRDGRVRPWRLVGLAADALPPSLEAAADLSRARETDGRSNAGGDRESTFPVTVGGRVVAILYADAAAPRTGALEVLTRYAGHVLESRTLHMALGIAAR